jgi:hypothetical protein
VGSLSDLRERAEDTTRARHPENVPQDLHTAAYGLGSLRHTLGVLVHAPSLLKASCGGVDLSTNLTVSEQER